MKVGKKSLDDHDSIQHNKYVNGICNFINMFNTIFPPWK